MHAYMYESVWEHVPLGMCVCITKHIEYNLLHPCNITCMCMHSGLTICYWMINPCALPLGRLFLQLCIPLL